MHGDRDARVVDAIYTMKAFRGLWLLVRRSHRLSYECVPSPPGSSERDFFARDNEKRTLGISWPFRGHKPILMTFVAAVHARKELERARVRRVLIARPRLSSAGKSRVPKNKKDQKGSRRRFAQYSFWVPSEAKMMFVFFSICKTLFSDIDTPVQKWHRVTF